MTWNSGPCVKPGDKPTPEVRAIHEAQVAQWDIDGQGGPGAARWPGHEIGTDEDVLERRRNGISEL